MPSSLTFERLSGKLAGFQASSEKMRLLCSVSTGSSHWDLYREQTNEKEAATPEEGKQNSSSSVLPRYPPPAKVGVAARQSGSVPLALQSRLVILDASFNPPTRAHAQMAKSAIRDAILEQRAAVAAAAALKKDNDGSGSDSGGTQMTILPETRLLLLLAVNNADKPADQPAPFVHRVAMMYDLAVALRDDLSEAGFGVPVDVGLTKEAYFSDKARAIEEQGWYTGRQEGGHRTFTKLDEEGNKYPFCAEGKLLWMDMPPMEFLTGFDTLARIFNPKYYVEEEGEEEEENEEYEEDEDRRPVSEASSTASFVMVRPPMTPMMRKLGPFFEKASLRVMLRPNGSWGSGEDQARFLAALAGGVTYDTGGIGGQDIVQILRQFGGDVKWRGKVRLLETDGNDEYVSGVSSSLVRDLIYGEGPAAATGLVYPSVLKWIEQNGLYKAPE